MIIKNNQYIKTESVNLKDFKNVEGKPDLTLLPTKIIYQILQVRMYGNAKYPKGGKDNWKNVPSIEFRKALYRHILKDLAGETIDPESGLSHLAHAATNIAFIMELEG